MMATPRKLATFARDLESVLSAAVAEHFLRCAACGAEQHPPRQDLARYFRDGWPKCCGQTMRLTAHSEEARP